MFYHGCRVAQTDRGRHLNVALKKDTSMKQPHSGMCTVLCFRYIGAQDSRTNNKKAMALIRALCDDSANFDELVRAYSNACNSKDKAEESQHGVSACVLQFIQKKYGTIKNFQNPTLCVNDAAVNGFTRIEKLRRALGALDRSGWDRSYHQRIFHVHMFAFLMFRT